MIRSFIKLFLVFFFINFNNQFALSHELMNAVRNNDIASIYTLLNEGVDPNSPDNHGYTALERATFFCYIEGIEVLLNAHADPYIMRKGETLLTIASRKGCIEAVRLLLNLNLDPNHRSKSGNTPLMFAAINGHTEIVRLLFDAGADPNSVNNDGKTPLMRAMEKNSKIEITEYLLAWGADPNSINNNETTAFMLASANCDVKKMELLLAYGADPYYISKKNNETSLFVTAKKGCIAATRMLLNMDINPNLNLPNKENKTPLMASVEARIERSEALKQVNMESSLLTEKIEEELRGSFYEGTPWVNIEEAHIEITNSLLNAGADPDIVDQDDFTPLMTAAIAGDIEIVRLLLAHSADPGYTNYLGYSALHYAEFNRDKKVACLIKQALNEMEECLDQ